jgi:hypothetical protein
LSEEGIVAIKVCDMACGSGHFLVGAGHRLARHLARVRAMATGESEPSPLLYPRAEICGDQMAVHELRPQRLTIREFPGFASVIVSKAELDLIIQQQIPSWKSALINVAGVYLITDTDTGKHYVGSAYGEGGFWQRWSEYSATGHGNNKALKELLAARGPAHADKFQFSILEIADTHASKDDVIARETHWKNALCSRESHGGYNAN